MAAAAAKPSDGGARVSKRRAFVAAAALKS